MPAERPIPPRLAASPEHPWYDTYWSPRVNVTLGGEKVSGVIVADTIDGWAEVYLAPIRIVGDKPATYRFRGEVMFTPKFEAVTADAFPAWSPEHEAEWVADCRHWRGKVLTGHFRHWCHDWDGLPMDETCQEWPCLCFDKVSGVLR